jgi:hypothetical protein
LGITIQNTIDVKFGSVAVKFELYLQQGVAFFQAQGGYGFIAWVYRSYLFLNMGGFDEIIFFKGFK